MAVAVGGNALVPRGTRPDAAAQVARIREVAPALAALTLQHQIVLVLGNGPQVGMLAVESAADPALAEPLQPVAAVVDKDPVVGLIAREIAADLPVLLTDLPAVLIGFGTPDRRAVGAVAPAQLRGLDLPDGSMGPKADASCAFVEAGGGRAAIGSLVDAAAVVAGTAGTQVVGPSPTSGVTQWGAVRDTQGPAVRRMVPREQRADGEL